jgi:hypothetical protein
MMVWNREEKNRGRKIKERSKGSMEGERGREGGRLNTKRSKLI